jgi:DnaK suppressor protein
MKTHRPTPFPAASPPPLPAEPAHPNFPAPECIPEQWAWHYRTLLQLRARLLAGEKPPSSATGPRHSTMDTTDGGDDHSERWAELNLEDNGLFEIDSALQRIREGVYGFCEETGQPIPAEELRAAPWQRYHRSASSARKRDV